MLGVAPTREGLNRTRDTPTHRLEMVIERNSREISVTHPRIGVQDRPVLR